MCQLKLPEIRILIYMALFTSGVMTSSAGEGCNNTSSKTDLGVLAGNVPSSPELQTCPYFQVSEGFASSHCSIWMIMVKKKKKKAHTRFQIYPIPLKHQEYLKKNKNK